MHPTAMINAKLFFDAYAADIKTENVTKVVDIGSQDVNGSLRTVTPINFDYIGVDFVEGNGVDIVLDSPYKLPFEDDSIDVVLSSSCFEHSEMFWLVFLEILRILKPDGLFYLNVPSNGFYHRYPVDCWRFYPDSGIALINWAKRNGINASLLESYVSNQHLDVWNDYVAVFLKEEKHSSRYKGRILDLLSSYQNGRVYGDTHIKNFSEAPEDLQRMSFMNQRLKS